MFGLWGNVKASGSFYRNFFAILAFLAFGAAIVTESPYGFLAVLLLGGLSRTAIKKGWKNPDFVEKSGFLIRRS